MKRRTHKTASRTRTDGGHSEEQIIAKLRRALSWPGAKNGVRLGIGDDAALLSPRKGFDTVLTCDWFLEGTHFLRDKHPADAIGWKCLARAVSDIAAMGGRPLCFLLSLALPSTHTGEWLEGFLGGLRRAGRRLGCTAVGGDTTKSERILINVTVVGEVRSGQAVLRSGARPGDLVFASGQLGEAQNGLRRLQFQKGNDSSDPGLRKHLYPKPRLHLGAWLAERGLATAMMDLSDGLSTDLARLCASSRVGARIESARVPAFAEPGIDSRNALTAALHGGDDYELLFTVSRRNRRRVPEQLGGIPLTEIGEITRQRALRLVDAKGSAQPLTNDGWDPFRKRA